MTVQIWLKNKKLGTLYFDIISAFFRDNYYHMLKKKENIIISSNEIKKIVENK